MAEEVELSHSYGSRGGPWSPEVLRGLAVVNVSFTGGTGGRMTLLLGHETITRGYCVLDNVHERSEDEGTPQSCAILSSPGLTRWNVS